MADYKLLSAVLADYADKAGTADSATTATTATTTETATYATTAGSATSATTATTATKLSAGTVGSASVPVYFSNGVPVEATGVSSGGVSWKSSSWNASSNTTSDILNPDGITSLARLLYVQGNSENAVDGITVMFIGTCITGESDGSICGTWYDYETATVISGFWTFSEFDEYISELSLSWTHFHYLA